MKVLLLDNLIFQYKNNGMKEDQPLTDAMVDQVVQRLSALADPTRVRILHRLQQGEADVSTLVTATGVAQASVSKHLSVLKAAGWVESRREGTRMICSVRDASVHDLCRIVCDGVIRQAKALQAELGIGQSN